MKPLASRPTLPAHPTPRRAATPALGWVLALALLLVPLPHEARAQVAATARAAPVRTAGVRLGGAASAAPTARPVTAARPGAALAAPSRAPGASGVRIASPVKLSITGPKLAPAGKSPAGRYRIWIDDRPASLELAREKDHYRGSYALGNGCVIGWLEGRTLRGYWKADTGEGTFIFAFHGRWSGFDGSWRQRANPVRLHRWRAVRDARAGVAGRHTRRGRCDPAGWSAVKETKKGLQGAFGRLSLPLAVLVAGTPRLREGASAELLAAAAFVVGVEARVPPPATATRMGTRPGVPAGTQRFVGGVRTSARLAPPPSSPGLRAPGLSARPGAAATSRMGGTIAAATGFSLSGSSFFWPPWSTAPVAQTLLADVLQEVRARPQQDRARFDTALAGLRGRVRLPGCTHYPLLRANPETWPPAYRCVGAAAATRRLLLAETGWDQRVRPADIDYGTARRIAASSALVTALDRDQLGAVGWLLRNQGDEALLASLLEQIARVSPRSPRPNLGCGGSALEGRPPGPGLRLIQPALGGSAASLARPITGRIASLGAALDAGRWRCTDRWDWRQARFRFLRAMGWPRWRSKANSRIAVEGLRGEITLGRARAVASQPPLLWGASGAELGQLALVLDVEGDPSDRVLVGAILQVAEGRGLVRFLDSLAEGLRKPGRYRVQLPSCGRAGVTRAARAAGAPYPTPFPPTYRCASGRPAALRGLTLTEARAALASPAGLAARGARDLAMLRAVLEVEGGEQDHPGLRLLRRVIQRRGLAAEVDRVGRAWRAPTCRTGQLRMRRRPGAWPPAWTCVGNVERLRQQRGLARRSPRLRSGGRTAMEEHGVSVREAHFLASRPDLLEVATPRELGIVGFVLRKEDFSVGARGAAHRRVLDIAGERGIVDSVSRQIRDLEETTGTSRTAWTTRFRDEHGVWPPSYRRAEDAKTLDVTRYLRELLGPPFSRMVKEQGGYRETPSWILTSADAAFLADAEELFAAKAHACRPLWDYPALRALATAHWILANETSHTQTVARMRKFWSRLGSGLGAGCRGLLPKLKASYRSAWCELVAEQAQIRTGAKGQLDAYRQRCARLEPWTVRDWSCPSGKQKVRWLGKPVPVYRCDSRGSPRDRLWKALAELGPPPQRPVPSLMLLYQKTPKLEDVARTLVEDRHLEGLLRAFANNALFPEAPVDFAPFTQRFQAAITGWLEEAAHQARAGSDQQAYRKRQISRDPDYLLFYLVTQQAQVLGHHFADALAVKLAALQYRVTGANLARLQRCASQQIKGFADRRRCWTDPKLAPAAIAAYRLAGQLRDLLDLLVQHEVVRLDEDPDWLGAHISDASAKRLRLSRRDPGYWSVRTDLHRACPGSGKSNRCAQAWDAFRAQALPRVLASWNQSIDGIVKQLRSSDQCPSDRTWRDWQGKENEFKDILLTVLAEFLVDARILLSSSGTGLDEQVRQQGRLLTKARWNQIFDKLRPILQKIATKVTRNCKTWWARLFDDMGAAFAAAGQAILAGLKTVVDAVGKALVWIKDVVVKFLESKAGQLLVDVVNLIVKALAGVDVKGYITTFKQVICVADKVQSVLRPLSQKNWIGVATATAGVVFDLLDRGLCGIGKKAAPKAPESSPARARGPPPTKLADALASLAQRFLDTHLLKLGKSAITKLIKGALKGILNTIKHAITTPLATAICASIYGVGIVATPIVKLILDGIFGLLIDFGVEQAVSRMFDFFVGVFRPLIDKILGAVARGPVKGLIDALTRGGGGVKGLLGRVRDALVKLLAPVKPPLLKQVLVHAVKVLVTEETAAGVIHGGLPAFLERVAYGVIRGFGEWLIGLLKLPDDPFMGAVRALADGLARGVAKALGTGLGTGDWKSALGAVKDWAVKQLPQAANRMLCEVGKLLVDKIPATAKTVKVALGKTVCDGLRILGGIVEGVLVPGKRLPTPRTVALQMSGLVRDLFGALIGCTAKKKDGVCALVTPAIAAFTKRVATLRGITDLGGWLDALNKGAGAFTCGLLGELRRLTGKTFGAAGTQTLNRLLDQLLGKAVPPACLGRGACGQCNVGIVTLLVSVGSKIYDAVGKLGATLKRAWKGKSLGQILADLWGAAGKAVTGAAQAGLEGLRQLANDVVTIFRNLPKTANAIATAVKDEVLGFLFEMRFELGTWSAYLKRRNLLGLAQNVLSRPRAVLTGLWKTLQRGGTQLLTNVRRSLQDALLDDLRRTAGLAGDAWTAFQQIWKSLSSLPSNPGAIVDGARSAVSLVTHLKDLHAAVKSVLVRMGKPDFWGDLAGDVAQAFTSQARQTVDELLRTLWDRAPAPAAGSAPRLLLPTVRPPGVRTLGPGLQPRSLAPAVRRLR